MCNLPGSCKSSTSPLCVSLSSSWAMRTKRRFLQIWRIGHPGPFPEEPPLNLHSKVLCHGISLVSKIGLFIRAVQNYLLWSKFSFLLFYHKICQSSTMYSLYSSFHPSCPSVTGAQSLMRANLITTETQIHAALVRTISLFYKRNSKTSQFRSVMECEIYEAVV